jgi:hypothetical protein
MGFPKVGSLQRVKPISLIRDQRAERTVRRLRKEFPQLQPIPWPILKRYAQLASLSEEIRQQILGHGITDANGEPATWIERFRATAQTELAYSRLIFGLDIRQPKPKDAKDWLDEIVIAQPTNDREESANDTD